MKRVRYIAAALALVCLAVVAFATRPKPPNGDAYLEGLWRNAITGLDADDNTQAKEALVQWIRDARPAGVRSPEAHFNLASAYWSLKESGPAVLHLLESARLSLTPGTLWRAHDLLAGTQRELGVSDAITRSSTYRLVLWLPQSYAWWIAALGFWGSLAVVLARTADKKRLPLYGWAILLCFPVALLALGLAAEFNRARGTFAVLDNAESTVGLFSGPQPQDDEKLLDLPSGTLVFSTDETRNGMTKVESPIVAWVDSELVKMMR